MFTWIATKKSFNIDKTTNQENQTSHFFYFSSLAILIRIYIQKLLQYILLSATTNEWTISHLSKLNKGRWAEVIREYHPYMISGPFLLTVWIIWRIKYVFGLSQYCISILITKGRKAFYRTISSPMINLVAPMESTRSDSRSSTLLWLINFDKIDTDLMMIYHPINFYERNWFDYDFGDDRQGAAEFWPPSVQFKHSSLYCITMIFLYCYEFFIDLMQT